MTTVGWHLFDWYAPVRICSWIHINSTYQVWVYLCSSGWLDVLTEPLDYCFGVLTNNLYSLVTCKSMTEPVKYCFGVLSNNPYSPVTCCTCMTASEALFGGLSKTLNLCFDVNPLSYRSTPWLSCYGWNTTLSRDFCHYANFSCFNQFHHIPYCCISIPKHVGPMDTR